MVKDGIQPLLPDVDAGQYLIDWLMEIGPTLPAGMGSGVLTFSEIATWQQLVGLELQPWEVRALRRLSEDYLAESNAATDPRRPPPYGDRQRNPSIDRQIDEALSTHL